MPKFYKPLVIPVRSVPVVVYPCEGVEQHLRRDDPESVARHLNELYERNRLTNKQGFDIDILWEDAGSLMTDRWEMTRLQSWGSGAFSEAKTYRAFDLDTTKGTSAEFGHIVLGEEAKQRLFECDEDMLKFLVTRPVLPQQITNDLNYYIR
jgi:hypothetical protein